MADSYLDIGGEPVFPLALNWQTAPSNTFSVTRYLQSFPGTSQSISELNEETPIILTGLFTIYNKSDEYDILEFIHTQMGRVVRFWVPYNKQMFELYEETASGASALNCYDNGAALSYNGYERIYIRMNDGDILTRWVTGVTDDNTKLTLALNSPLDRAIGLDDYSEIGRFLLVRFDSDTFEFNYETDTISDFNQRFYELVKEYDELVTDDELE